MSAVTCPRFLRAIYSPLSATKTVDSPLESVKSHSLPETLEKMAPRLTSPTRSRKNCWIWVPSLVLKSQKRKSYRNFRETLVERARLAAEAEAGAEAEEAFREVEAEAEVASLETAVVEVVSPETEAEVDASLEAAFREAAIAAAAAGILPATAAALNAETAADSSAETEVVSNAETAAAAAGILPAAAATAEKADTPPPPLDLAVVIGLCNERERGSKYIHNHMHM